MNKGTMLSNGIYMPIEQGGIYVKSYKRGKHTYGDPVVMNYCARASLTIGDYCSIADGVEILLGGEHHTEFVSTFPFKVNKDGYPCTHGDVEIGNDVFIGRNVTILSGVTVGDGAVIGAGSSVAKDVPPYGIFVGNKTIKKRFSDYQIDKLLDIEWWKWDEKKVLSFVTLLQSPNIDEFIREAQNVL